MLSKHKPEMGSIEGYLRKTLKYTEMAREALYQGLLRTMNMAVHVSTPVISSMSNLVYDMFKWVFLFLICLDCFKNWITYFKKKSEPNVYVMWEAMKTKFANHWPGNTAL